MKTFETDSAEQTHELGRRFAERLHTGDCVGLIGPLGAGKTVMVRGIAVGLEVPDERIVSSPTYVLVKEYAGRVTIYHVDLYRLEDPEAELADLGLEEMLADGVVLIEWADRAAGAIRPPHWEIEISPTGAESRRFEVRRID